MGEDSGRGESQAVDPTRLVVVAGLMIALLGVAIASPFIMAAVADSGVHVTLNPTRDEVKPGETVQVGVTVQNHADTTSPAPVLTVNTLPTGWVIASWSGTDAAYRNSTDEWLWTTIEPGESIKFTVTISIPADASGEEAIGVALTDGDNRTAAADITLTVRESTATDEADSSDEGDGPSVVYEVPGFGFQITVIAIFVLSGILARN